MTKIDFINGLSAKLQMLPQNEIDKSTLYYSEIISDRIEDGMSEEDAVAAIGNLNDIAQNILYDMSLPTLMKAKMNESKKNSSNTALWIVLAIVGFPIWLPLLISFVAVIFSLYVSVWSVIISLYAVLFALGVTGVLGLIIGIIKCFAVSPVNGLFLIGLAVISVALTLFMIHPIIFMTKKLIQFTRFVLQKIKSLFISKKEVA